MAELLTPHGSLEGFQEIANGVAVSGWAWDRETPDIAVTVAIYDNGALLGTVVAEGYRKDLREAGIGDGQHGFVYALAHHLRDRKAHRITVRIAGTDVILRDLRTGGPPDAITRHDQPAPIPHFSMPLIWRWAYFIALPRVLAIFPHPVWRPLAVVLACIHVVLDRQSRVLNVALLRALGKPTSLWSRYRLHWDRAYQRQTDLILLGQSAGLTPRWAARQVRVSGSLPSGGAILVSVHHNGSRLAYLALAAQGYRLGVITTRLYDPDAIMQTDVTLQNHWRLSEKGGRDSFGERRFSRHEAGRKGLQLLREGGYLILNADEYARREPFSPLLGRSMTVPRGAVWFAQHSGKPIIPHMAVPEGLHWQLWLGEAAVCTQQGLCHAIEECIRRAPGSWQRFMAMAWLAAPPFITDESSP